MLNLSNASGSISGDFHKTSASSPMGLSTLSPTATDPIVTDPSGVFINVSNVNGPPQLWVGIPCLVIKSKASRSTCITPGASSRSIPARSSSDKTESPPSRSLSTGTSTILEWITTSRSSFPSSIESDPASSGLPSLPFLRSESSASMNEWVGESTLTHLTFVSRATEFGSSNALLTIQCMTVPSIRTGLNWGCQPRATHLAMSPVDASVSPSASGGVEPYAPGSKGQAWPESARTFIF